MGQGRARNGGSMRQIRIQTAQKYRCGEVTEQDSGHHNEDLGKELWEDFAPRKKVIATELE